MTTEPNPIADLMRDRSKIIDLLCEARKHLAGATVYLSTLEHYAPHLRDAQNVRRNSEAFLARGLFGDKEETK